MATVMNMDPNPHNVVPVAFSSTKNIIEAAGANSEVKRFVLTSSSAAAYTPHPDTPGTITTDSYNEEAIKDAWAPPPYGMSRGFQTYSASKAQGERLMWKWHDDHKAERPDLVFNSILPNANVGVVLDLKHQGLASSVGYFKPVWDGAIDEHVAMFPPQYYVDVQDTARLHVAALLMKDVQQERLFSFADTWTIETELAAFRKAAPQRKFPDAPATFPRHLYKVPNERAEELLRKLGRKGWTSLEESFAHMARAYEKVDAESKKKAEIKI